MESEVNRLLPAQDDAPDRIERRVAEQEDRSAPDSPSFAAPTRQLVRCRA